MHLYFLSIPDWETKPEIQGASEEGKSEGSLKEKLGRKGPPSPKFEVYVLDGRLGTEKESPTVEACKKLLQSELGSALSQRDWPWALCPSQSQTA